MGVLTISVLLDCHMFRGMLATVLVVKIGRKFPKGRSCVVPAFMGKHVARERQQEREKRLARTAGYQKLRMIMATGMVPGRQHDMSWKYSWNEMCRSRIREHDSSLWVIPHR